MDTSILEDIGLTQAEIKVYLALLELGESTAGPIIKKTGLQNSVIHGTLPRLLQKGLAVFIKKGHTRYYHITEPDAILKLIDERRDRFKNFLPELLRRQKPVERQEVEIYEGLRGHRVMLYDFIEDATRGDEYLFFSFYAENSNDFDDMFELYNEFSEERERLGIVTKGIIPAQVQDKFKGRINREDLLFVDVPVLTNITIFNDKVFMTPWEARRMSFLIYSRQLADMYRRHFYSIWGKYKDKQ